MLSVGYRAFENILRYTSLVEYNSVVNLFEIVKEMCALFLFDVIVSRPVQCQVKKQIY